MTNGQPLVVRGAMKPISTLMKLSCKPNQSNSTRIQSRKLLLKPISRATEFFHSAA